jgi:hypothetical protein
METDLHRVIRTQDLSDDHCQYFIYQVRWVFSFRSVAAFWYHARHFGHSKPCTPRTSFIVIWSHPTSYWIQIAISRYGNLFGTDWLHARIPSPDLWFWTCQVC